MSTAENMATRAVDSTFYRSLVDFATYREYATEQAGATTESFQVGTLPEFFAPQPVPTTVTQLR